jgi:hypothetical protein
MGWATFWASFSQTQLVAVTSQQTTTFLIKQSQFSQASTVYADDPFFFFSIGKSMILKRSETSSRGIGLNFGKNLFYMYVRGRVAKWYISKPKIPKLGKFWKVLQWKTLLYFMTFGLTFWAFGKFCGKFDPVLVYYANKNLASMVRGFPNFHFKSAD